MAENLRIKVMTFNLWESGLHSKNGLEKIASHIRKINPDFVSLQEVYWGFLPKLLRILGPEWREIHKKSLMARFKPDCAILARHPIVGFSIPNTRFLSATLKLPNDRLVNFWAVHFAPEKFGPDLVRKSKEPQEKRRVKNIQKLLQTISFRKNLLDFHKIPIIIAGDFNSPSHLDWIESTKHLHNNFSFDWPVTKAFERELGFSDSFRDAHPNCIESPGNTWSLVDRLGPCERIDFILHKGGLRVISAENYSGNEPIRPKPHHRQNDWPSDHCAIIVEFEFSHLINVTPAVQL